MTAEPTQRERTFLEAVRAFLATLEPHKEAKAVLSFETEERFNWHYVPRDRHGLPLKQMNEAQRRAALAVLRAGLSQKGFQKTETIRQLEIVLQAIEKGTGPIRDPDLFYLTVFGAPSEKGVWGLRYEGHHISLHWTVIEGRVVATCPQFLGANPAEVREGAMKGVRALSAEEDLAYLLLNALTPEQRKTAVLSETAPADIFTAASRIAAMQEDRGLAYSQMTKPQQGMLMAIIQEYAATMPQELARARLERLRKAGLESVKFSWMGGLERAEPHYYRIQGRTFLIEFDNTQNNANHIHLVWRDFQGDFGRDLLAEHYRRHSHAPGAPHTGG